MRLFTKARRVIALAAYRDGDTVLISDNPGTGPEPGSGYVSQSAPGRAGTVMGEPIGDCLLIRFRPAEGGQCLQFIHVDHLTRAVPVPA
ncbi:hypothetical protein ACFCV3_42030 [Kribbella sp. NPDC056345]|uniref:hypothetical protein n=1 Tax=Kribbella sp. NPDC056345 TaxID=3345789 RepID=UPI0035D9346E